jgi:hypothetical protein
MPVDQDARRPFADAGARDAFFDDALKGATRALVLTRVC